MAKSFTIESRMTPPPCDPPALDYPVTQKENLKLLLEGKIPYWVPMMGLDHQMTSCQGDNDRPPYGTSGQDWFGVSWTYVDTVGGQTVSPNSFIMEDMSHWREKFIFPDLDKIMHREVGILNIVNSSFRLNHGLLIFCNDLPVRYCPR